MYWGQLRASLKAGYRGTRDGTPSNDFFFGEKEKGKNTGNIKNPTQNQTNLRQQKVMAC